MSGAGGAGLPAELFESLPLSVMVFDAGWRILFVNWRAEQAARRRRDELVGRVLWEEFPELAGGEFEARYRRSAESRVPVHFEVWWEKTDEWYEIYTAPWRDGLVAYYHDVTARKHAERAVLTSEARFRMLVEQSPLSTQVLSPDGWTVQVNRAWEELWGATFDDIADYNMLEDRQLVEKGVMPYIERAVAGEACAIPAIPYDPNETLPDRSAHAYPERVVRAVVYPVKDEAGRVTEVVLVHEDVTDRARAEEQLRSSRDQLEIILQGVADGIGVQDASGRVVYANEAAARMSGYDSVDSFLSASTGELRGRFVLMDEEGRPFPYERLPGRRVLAGEPFAESVVRFRVVATGEERWSFVQARPVLDAKGRPQLAVNIFHDVTERRRAEEAQRFLGEASALLAATLDYETTLATVARLAVPRVCDWCAVDVVGEDGALERLAVAHVDPEKVEWAGELHRLYPPDPGAGEGLHAVLRTGRSGFYPEVTDEMLAGTAVDARHLEMLRKVGFTSAMIVPLAARDRVLGAITFVTAESRHRLTAGDLALAEELARRAGLAVDNARLYREARDASRLKDEFLATISHELRTPLNAMLGWARMLRTGRLDAPTAERGLEAIERNAQAQAQLIEDILDASRAITGKLRLEVGPVDIAAVVGEAVESVQPAAHAKGVELRTAAGDGAGVLLGDADRLRQIVWNLLSNAIKFTPKGGRVEVRLDRDGADARIAVADTGIGIEPEFLGRVFERFSQADGTLTRAHGGLGLGLAIVRHLVELHGGTVEAASEGAGRGATFTVRVPVAGAEQLEPAAPPPAAAGAAGALPHVPALEGVDALVVDDEEDALEMLRAVLESCRMRVRTERSAAAALEAVRAAPPELLIADIAMPGEDGYSLMRKVRALPAGEGGAVRAVALTALARDEDRRLAFEAGFDRFAAKPVDPAALVRTIAELLRGAADERR